jgi:hypothetical protein
MERVRLPVGALRAVPLCRREGDDMATAHAWWLRLLNVAVFATVAAVSHNIGWERGTRRAAGAVNFLAELDAVASHKQPHGEAWSLDDRAALRENAMQVVDVTNHHAGLVDVMNLRKSGIGPALVGDTARALVYCLDERKAMHVQLAKQYELCGVPSASHSCVCDSTLQPGAKRICQAPECVCK